MNYKWHYNKLIDRAKNRNLSCYTESHHITPKCMGGTDNTENLVKLTPREHFIAHLLLLKIYPNKYSLIKAVNMMCTGHRRYRSMNRMYGWLRERFSNEMSRSQSGNGNSQFGKKWIYNPVLKINKKIFITDNIPEGWFQGRILNFETFFKKIQRKKERELERQKYFLQKQINFKKKQQNQNKKIEYKKYILNLYEEFKKGNYYSISEFHRKNNLKISLMTISNYWRKYIQEYKKNSKEGKRYRI
jgi:hypothetical protein